MHQSRVSVICLDIPSEKREASESFWGGLLNASPRAGTEYPEYSVLGAHQNYLFLLQAIEGEARIHLDIHTDNLEAEVDRLVALGAVVQYAHGDWVTLRDPAGLLFCVVPVSSDDPSLLGATTWTY
jgi:hypothetical protein